jgi:hypothetical protein
MLSPVEELRMPSDEWIKALADGRRVKFTYQELPDEGAFVTAQVVAPVRTAPKGSSIQPAH